MPADESGSAEERSWSMPGAHGTEGKRRHGKSGSESSSDPPPPCFTEEQSNAVKNIRKCKNYYEILGVSQDCTEDDLKKAYKKLALKFHPDKNQAPGTTEAFKAISNAFSVLTDPTKRQRYDQYGSEEEERAPVPQYYEYDYTRGGFEGDISAEELFNVFFGSGFQPAGARVRTPFHRATRAQFHHHHHREPQHNESQRYAVLVQLGPIMFLLVLSVLTALMAGEAVYSTRHTQKYSIPRKTSSLGVSYYVKPDFATTFKGSLLKLESQVEEEYIANLRSNCYRERMYRESLMWQARSYRNARMYEEAESTKTPSCDTLQEVYG